MVSVSSTVPVCAFHGNGDVETPRRNLEGPVLRSGRSAEENGGNIIIWIEVIVESLVGRDRLCYGGGGGRCYRARPMITGPSGFLSGLSSDEEGRVRTRRLSFTGRRFSQGHCSSSYSRPHIFVYGCLLHVLLIKCPNKVFLSV